MDRSSGAWIIQETMALRRENLLTGNVMIDCHQNCRRYFNADCDACTAHPPVPDVPQAWLPSVEK